MPDKINLKFNLNHVHIKYFAMLSTVKTYFEELFLKITNIYACSYV